jgi:hypothetical protein
MTGWGSAAFRRATFEGSCPGGHADAPGNVQYECNGVQCPSLA